VKEFPPPKNIKELQQFLGLAGYYRRFIKNFAHIANPLNTLLRKNIKFIWNNDQKMAFETLKQKLMALYYI